MSRHQNPQECEWREQEPTSYGPDYRSFVCLCPDPDCHLVRSDDEAKALQYLKTAE